MRKPTLRRGGDYMITIPVEFHLNRDEIAAYYWLKYLQPQLPEKIITKV